MKLKEIICWLFILNESDPVGKTLPLTGFSFKMLIDGYLGTI